MLSAGRVVVEEGDRLYEGDSQGLRSHLPSFSSLSPCYGWRGSGCAQPTLLTFCLEPDPRLPRGCLLHPPHTPRGSHLQASWLCAAPSTSALPLNFLLLSPDNPRILFIPFPSLSFPYPAPPALYTPREVFQIWGQGTPGWEFIGPGWGVLGPAPPSSASQLVNAPVGLTAQPRLSTA